jgi:hypothetical protein
MVTVAEDAAAVLAAVNVTVLWPAIRGPKAAVTPAGSPDAANATVALKPFCAVIATVLAPLVPGLMLMFAGAAESVKLAGAATVSVIGVRLVALPELPVTVTIELPGAALAAALNVRVVLRVAGAGLNVAVMPAGKPVTEKATVELKLPCEVTVRVLMALPLWEMLRLAGDAAMV